MLGPDLELLISIPEQNLGELSYTDSTPEAFADWVANLPMANLGELSRQLYRAINELNRLKCKPETRSKMLEDIRKPIHYACEELSKHFLNASITPQEKQRKVINLVTSLHLSLAAGYKAVLLESVPNLGSEPTRKNFSCAAHRTITEFGRVQLLSAKLYISVPKMLWKEMNEIYRFSDELGLMKYLVRDEDNLVEPDSSIKSAYKRNLLLACCRSNQLRKQEIDSVWVLFERWANYVELGRKYLASAVFCINLSEDQAPRHKSLLHEELSDFYYGFDTAELITRITSHLSSANSTITHLEMPINISNGLLHHLHHSLGILTKRTFKRIASDGSLELAVGLSAMHYYTSGRTSFQPHLFGMEPIDLDNSTESRVSRAKSNDPWSNAFDAAAITSPKSIPSESVIDYTNHPESADKDFPVHTTSLINTSPGGYCIQWGGHIPKNVQAGELLCVRENDEKSWSIAVIRWIRYSKQKGTQLGIELLAPRAKPCAVQQLNKTGKHSEFLRGLLLPELSSISQPSTLITPRLPFKEGNKVILRFSGIESKCILAASVSETGSFSQYTLRATDVLDSKSAQLEEETQQPKTEISLEDEFDSLWPSL
ncbi:MAG: GTPase [Oleiphilaceae bacterium]|nr:GTPase [Oleiphilaceae bacterium]